MASNIYLNQLSINQGFNITHPLIALYSDPSSVLATNIGFSLSNIGDIDNDSFDDFIIGLDFSSGTSCVIFGSQSSSFINNINLANFDHIDPAQGFQISIDYNAQSLVGPFSTGSAGDINGDGYNDMLIGVTQTHYNEYNWTVYVVFGGKREILDSPIKLNLLTTQGFAISGSTKSQLGFGYSVSSAGNFNGDAYGDIIIGCPYYPYYLSSYYGASYIIYGNKTKILTTPNYIDINNLTPDKGFIIIGSNSENSGTSVSGGGDVNGDGYDDVIIGAPAYASGPTHGGASYVVFGSNKSHSAIYLSNFTSNNPQGFRIYSTNLNNDAKLGYSVSNAGDFNNDSFADILIGAPQVTFNAVQPGASYLIFGSSTSSNIDLSKSSGDPSKWITLTSKTSHDYVGYSVSTAGDFNHDSCGDIIIGSPSTSTAILSGNNPGYSYVVYGCQTHEKIIYLEDLSSSNELGFIIFGGIANYSGYSVSGGGDINGDGYSDVIIGAPDVQPLGAWSTLFPGAAYVIFGGPTSPTAQPSPSPTKIPTDNPTMHPTSPTQTPTMSPIGPTFIPTISPTQSPTYDPAFAPTFSPTKHYTSLWDSIISSPAFVPIVSSTIIGASALSFRSLSKHICFSVLKNAQKKETTSATKRTYSYWLCNKWYGVAYAQRKQADDLFNQDNRDEDLLLGAEDIHQDETDDLRLGEITLSETKESGMSDDIQVFTVIHQNNDVENPLSNSDTEISKQNTKSLNYNKGRVFMSIDAMMDQEHVRLQNEAFAKFGEDLFGYNFITGNNAITVTSTTKAQDKIADMPIQSAPTADNIHFSTSNNDLMLSLLNAQQLVEYIPIIRYIVQGFNVTLPTILDNKPMLITSHLVLGNAAAALLPYGSIANGMITSSIATSSYAMRLVSVGYLVEQKQEILAKNEPISSFEILKYCGASMLAYTAPSLAKCAVTKWFIPEAECSFSGYDLSISASLGGADCYAVYKTTSEPSISTTADISMPWIADAIAFAITSQYVTLDMSSTVMALQSVKKAMIVVSAVVATDYMSRIAMDMMPNEFKEIYAEPIFNYVVDTLSCGINYLNQLSE